MIQDQDSVEMEKRTERRIALCATCCFFIAPFLFGFLFCILSPILLIVGVTGLSTSNPHAVAVQAVNSEVNAWSDVRTTFVTTWDDRRIHAQVVNDANAAFLAQQDHAFDLETFLSKYDTRSADTQDAAHEEFLSNDDDERVQPYASFYVSAVTPALREPDVFFQNVDTVRANLTVRFGDPNEPNVTFVYVHLTPRLFIESVERIEAELGTGVEEICSRRGGDYIERPVPFPNCRWYAYLERVCLLIDPNTGLPTSLPKASSYGCFNKQLFPGSEFPLPLLHTESKYRPMHPDSINRVWPTFTVGLELRALADPEMQFGLIMDGASSLEHLETGVGERTMGTVLVAVGSPLLVILGCLVIVCVIILIVNLAKTASEKKKIRRMQEQHKELLMAAAFGGRVDGEEAEDVGPVADPDAVDDWDVIHDPADIKAQEDWDVVPDQSLLPRSRRDRHRHRHRHREEEEDADPDPETEWDVVRTHASVTAKAKKEWRMVKERVIAEAAESESEAGARKEWGVVHGEAFERRPRRHWGVIRSHAKERRAQRDWEAVQDHVEEHQHHSDVDPEDEVEVDHGHGHHHHGHDHDHDDDDVEVEEGSVEHDDHHHHHEDHDDPDGILGVDLEAQFPSG